MPKLSEKSQIVLLNKKLEAVIAGINTHLKRQWNEGFPQRSFYGETFWAATLAMLDEQPNLQIELINHYLEREGSATTGHQEFNLYALQHWQDFQHTNRFSSYISKASMPKLFLRKVSNWVLLRSIVNLKRGNSFWANIQAKLVLTVNSVADYITDNTLRFFYRRNTSLSQQYHIFATLLVGELYGLTKDQFYLDRFYRGVNLFMGWIDENGELTHEGRGRKQIFGYAAGLYSLALAYQYSLKSIYLEKFEKVFTFLSSYQVDDGSIPLVLSDNNPSPYLYSYNNFYDYQAFLLFYLVRCHVTFRQKTN